MLILTVLIVLCLSDTAKGATNTRGTVYVSDQAAADRACGGLLNPCSTIESANIQSPELILLVANQHSEHFTVTTSLKFDSVTIESIAASRNYLTPSYSSRPSIHFQSYGQFVGSGDLQYTDLTLFSTSSATSHLIVQTTGALTISNVTFDANSSTLLNYSFVYCQNITVSLEELYITASGSIITLTDCSGTVDGVTFINSTQITDISPLTVCLTTDNANTDNLLIGLTKSINFTDSHPKAALFHLHIDGVPNLSVYNIYFYQPPETSHFNDNDQVSEFNISGNNANEDTVNEIFKESHYTFTLVDGQWNVTITPSGSESGSAADDDEGLTDGKIAALVVSIVVFVVIIVILTVRFIYRSRQKDNNETNEDQNPEQEEEEKEEPKREGEEPNEDEEKELEGSTKTPE